MPRDQLIPGRAIFSARPPRQVHSSLAWRGPWYLRAWRASRCQCPRAGGEVDPGEGEDSGAKKGMRAGAGAGAGEVSMPSSRERYEIIWWCHGLLYSFIMFKNSFFLMMISNVTLIFQSFHRGLKLPSSHHQGPGHGIPAGVPPWNQSNDYCGGWVVWLSGCSVRIHGNPYMAHWPP